MDPFFDPQKELDKVLGRKWKEDPTRQVRSRLFKWIGGALAAVAIAALVVYVLEANKPAPGVKAKPPVPIRIVPESPSKDPGRPK